jgi:2-polyprenyl-3-methyl-5-hydroxy-6-metoxy-1,4-benzoquinol methylase
MTEIQENYGWQSPEPTPAHDYILPAIIRLLSEGKPLRILDAGCGNGFLAGQLSAMGHQVVGVDISADGVNIARQRYPQIPFFIASLYEDLRSIATDVDLIISSEVIEHLYFPKIFINRMRMLIRTGGHIILTTPYHGYLKNLAISLMNAWDAHHTTDWEGGHIKFFSETSLSTLLKQAGFCDLVFNNSGRFPFFWKSMVCRAKKRD